MAAPLMNRNGVEDGLLMTQKPLLLKYHKNTLPGRFYRKSSDMGDGRAKNTVILQDTAIRKAVLMIPIQVGAVPEGSAHNGTRSLFHADMGIGQNRNLMTIEGNPGLLPYIGLEPGILGMNENSHNPIEELGAGSGDQ